jgi:hypothetical protein
MNDVWKNHSLTIVLVGLFIFSLASQFFAGWQDHASQQAQHGLGPEFMGYLWLQLNEMFANWQSEFLQVLAVVQLTKFFAERGSKESKEPEETPAGNES